MKKIFLLCFLLNLNIFANTETISLDFELSRTAINRAIVSQFNDPNFVFHHFTGQFEFLPGQTVPYYVTLARPTVEIDENTIGIHLVFSVSLPSLGYNYELDITPDITINEQSIKVSEVIAFIEELEGAINSCPGIPQSVKDLIFDLYDTYEPQVYASSLYNEALEEINSNDFFQQRSFNISGFGFEMELDNGKLILRITITINYEGTAFYARIDPNDNTIELQSNIKCYVRSIIFYTDNLSQEFYANENLNIEMQKNSNFTLDYYMEKSIGNFAINSSYALYVLFETDNTFYYNKYLCAPYYWKTPDVKINH
jgi:hypothetical protein